MLNFNRISLSCFVFINLFTILNPVPVSAQQNDPFETHDQAMRVALKTNNTSKIEALLQTPYILDENIEEYSWIAMDQNMFDLVEFFIIKFDLDVNKKRNGSSLYSFKRNIPSTFINKLSVPKSLVETVFNHGGLTHDAWSFLNFCGGGDSKKRSELLLILMSVCENKPSQCTFPIYEKHPKWPKTAFIQNGYTHEKSRYLTSLEILDEVDDADSCTVEVKTLIESL